MTIMKYERTGVVVPRSVSENMIWSIAQAATRILVPSSKDSGECITAFTQSTGIEVPEDVWETMQSNSGGRTFRLARGADMPGQIAAGWADIGIASTELQVEYGQGKTVGFATAEKPVCRYGILALENMAYEARRMLEQPPQPPQASLQRLRIPATFPKTLNYAAARLGLPLRALDVPISGKGEPTMQASGVGMMAERIRTGKSARKVGAVEVCKLLDLLPMMLVSAQDAEAT